MLDGMAGGTTEISSMVELVAEAVKEKGCVLFLGAAVHARPPDGSLFEYPEAVRPPVGETLSRALAKKCDFERRFDKESPANLQRVALAYELGRSRRALVDEIAKAVDEKTEPSPILHALARMDFSIIITTNYDQLFEQALRMAGKKPRVAVYKPEHNNEPTVDPRDPTAKSPIIYKLHGDIERRESLVITDEDYIQFVLRMGDKEPFDPIPMSLKYYLTGGKTTLFLGYSLLDYNLRLLLKTLRHKIDSANVPEMYSVDRQPDELILKVWENERKYVKFIADDVWSFVPQLYRLVVGEEMEPS
jgi:hypothetical protein